MNEAWGMEDHMPAIEKSVRETVKREGKQRNTDVLQRQVKYYERLSSQGIARKKTYDVRSQNTI